MASATAAIGGERPSFGLRRAIDRRVLAAVGVHLAVVALALAAPAALGVPLLALGMVWASNTVSHIHLHTPLFVSRGANRALSLYLTLACGVPQTVWRHRHLRHHAKVPSRVPPPPRARVAVEVLALAALAGLLAAAGVLVPWALGIAAGYGLCALQGHMEHWAGVAEGWSTYGRWHNRLWFNNVHHAEHHRHPGMHWSELPRLARAAQVARCGPLTRALDVWPWALAALERLALRSPGLQRALVAVHARAFTDVLGAREVRHALIVGGGLFPRTALVLAQVRPGATLTIVDAEPAHLARARALLDARGITARYQCEVWRGEARAGVDLVSVPLALRGARFAGDGTRVVHTWLWERARGRPSAVVAWWLLKRVVLVEPERA